MSLVPQDENELAEIIRDAAARVAPLRLVGSDTKRAFGRPSRGEALSLAAFSGVTLYEPEELVLTAGAATPRAEIEALLDAKAQELAFEPIDFGALFGSGAGTIGGLVATGASGPRRIKAGALRDHLLGFRCVTGRGEIVKSGGRVMKNVTGYDLSKLVAGSFGTLAALTEVTLKVLPKASSEATLLQTGLDEAASLAALRKASQAQADASGFAMLPAGSRPLSLARNVAAIRLEGAAISLDSRRDELVALLAPRGGAFETLDADASRALWRRLRDAEPVARAPGDLWRVSLAPTNGAKLLENLHAAGAAPIAHFYDWAGGLVWLCFEPTADARAGVLRRIVEELGGQATLLRAEDEIRARVGVFQPKPAALAALSRRVKESFDPAHILERGRLCAEF
ncbi:glycolate oxidase subunit GlcE [Methylocystis bryophila]|uniref:Glycolate oxidase subunit GlcE n=1 Tax=Methylocystis bryophila TaxID=655015 RepID=A0A1W6MR62_9HYPH|nr:glycolate oxidase subunit GlcE [Methylocystis bryophila]ARN80078.1 glycolate oxidase subunit GlcE [Methylocystis bryophila]BDV39997.1 2-hydroxy-acid oxidase [Methylocystis bryophila]